MNMNPFPRGFEHARERRPLPRHPLPRWVWWLAAALVFGGLGVLQELEHHTEQAIQQAIQKARK